MKYFFFACFVFLLGCDESTGGGDFCGDAVVDVGEDCDGANLGDQSCTGLGYHGGTLLCDSDCAFDVSGCQAQGECGNGEIEVGTSEECDGNSLGGATCLSLGYYGGTLSCDTECIFDVTGCEPQGRCGDGLLQTAHGETCDGGELGEDDCLSLGYYGGAIACNDNCRYDVTDCALHGLCGDSIIQSPAGEECDSANLGGESCESRGWYDGVLACDNACKVDESDCASFGMCGDGLIQSAGGETCDGTELGGATCLSRGFWGGELLCNAGCTFDESECRSAVAISTGFHFSCALDNFGEAWCWGSGEYGQLGDGTYGPGNLSLVPVAVAMPPGLTFTRISVSNAFACAVDNDGDVWCWGVGNSGQIGNGSFSDAHVPTAIDAPSDITFNEVATGDFHVCARGTGGDVWCWGLGTWGALGDNDLTNHMSNVPVPVSGGHQLHSITCGSQFCCGLDSLGAGWCWGNDADGRLGNGSFGGTGQGIPVAMSMPGGLILDSISAGTAFACGRSSVGNIFCWGLNHRGQLGSGNTESTAVAAQIADGGTYFYFSPEGGGVNACTIRNNDTLWCWGGNYYGQIGDGTTGTLASAVTNPVEVLHPSGGVFAQVTPGDGHTCAIDTQGLLWCWGDSSHGQLGTGDTTNQASPHAVASPPQD